VRVGCIATQLNCIPAQGLDHLCSVPTRYISCPQNAHFKTYNTPCMAVMYTCQYIRTSCCPMFARHENVSWQSSQHRTGCRLHDSMLIHRGHWETGLPHNLHIHSWIDKGPACPPAGIPLTALGQTAHNLQAQPGHTFTCACCMHTNHINGRNAGWKRWPKPREMQWSCTERIQDKPTRFK
jgi:hypothetical protein